MANVTKTIKSTAGAAALMSIGLTGAAAAESLFDGCPSGPIIQRFIEFGKTGQMPKDLGKWLNTPADQYVEPWKPFDNVDYVGVCWVSAWLVHTDDGVVMIDTLYGPFKKMIV
jgi:metallo-beta-lactamase class B